MELPHIGQNCVICNRNDYLPFKCTHCDKIVCIDHKTNHGFECPLNINHFETFTSNNIPNESLKQACDYCRKITLKLELVECVACKGFHCLYHRHQVQHNCRQLAECKEAREEEAVKKSERQKAALEKLKTVTTNIQSTSKPASSTSENLAKTSQKTLNPKQRDLARRVKLMKLKQSARGPPNILQEDKIFFEVKFQHEPKATLSNSSKHDKSVRIFTTPKHTIGRMIDWSSAELGVINKNHLAESSQLVFEKLNESNDLIILNSQRCFSHYLNSGELLDGDDIILTYK